MTSEDLHAAIASAFLGGWLLLSVLAQAQGPIRKRLLHPRWLGLVPSFRFFGDALGETEVVVETRGQGPDGDWSGWAPVAHGDAGPLRALWSPERRARQAVADAAVDLLRREGGRDVERTPAWRGLAATALASHRGARAARFRVIVADPTGQRIAFRSARIRSAP